MIDEFKYCKVCEDPLLEEDVLYEEICNECGDLEVDAENDGNLKWSCQDCEHIWLSSPLITWADCPKCESEDVGHF